MNWKRCRGALLICLLCLALAVPMHAAAAGSGSTVSAPDWPSGPETASDGVCLMEATTGIVLYEKNMDERFYPASVTKILTALLAVENLSLDEMITYTADDIYSLEPGASTIALRPGEALPVSESLYGLLLASGNECANGLARQTAGSVSAFVELMNARLQELGCTGTHFANPHGLHNENHYTTPHDMARIMRAAVSNETYLRFDSTRTHIIPETNLVHEKRPVKMRHEMMDRYGKRYDERVVAGKTGYTSYAGNTLVTYAVKGDLKLVCVVMHSEGQQYEDTKALLDYGFSNFHMFETSSAETRYKVSAGSGREIAAAVGDSQISVRFAADSWAVAPKNVEFADLESRIEFAADGESMGRVVYLYQGMEVGSAGLTLEEGEGPRFPFSVRKGLKIYAADGESRWNVPLCLLVCVCAAAAAAVLIRLLRRRRRGGGEISFRTDRKKKKRR